jgi:hypothetical protein
MPLLTFRRWVSEEMCVVKFRLEVDLDKLSGDQLFELGRILRFWAGNLKHYPIEPGTRETISDSEYVEVGEWRILADGAESDSAG